MEFPVGLFTVFAAGVISFLSPCVLPLVPAYLSYVVGESVDELKRSRRPRLAAMGLSLCFVLGFTSVFVLLGASTTAIGRLLLAYRYEVNLVAGALVIAFGIFMTGLIRPRWLLSDYRVPFRFAFPPGIEPLAAYALGLAFGFGWTPCIGPVLGSILTFTATGEDVGRGVTILGVYAAGLGVPFLLAAAFTTSFIARLRAFGRLGRALHLTAGLVLIVVGIAMITGHLTVFAYWLLKTFPALGGIG